jgi:hypothetical protein
MFLASQDQASSPADLGLQLSSASHSRRLQGLTPHRNSISTLHLPYHHALASVIKARLETSPDSPPKQTPTSPHKMPTTDAPKLQAPMEAANPARLQTGEPRGEAIVTKQPVSDYLSVY